MAHWSEEYLQLIEDCEARDSRVSTWEVGFLDSLKRQVLDGKIPTKKQTEKLDDVWERVTSKG